MTWSEGQNLAIEQLTEIADASERSLSIIEITPPADKNSRAKVKISISTKHFVKTKGGLPLRNRERLILHIPQRFPLSYPSVYTEHKRFADFFHVQWTNFLCLYRSPEIEWSPDDGMYGFIQRLNNWLSAGALNELDPDDAPLHPPVVNKSSNIGIVIRANSPRIEDDEWFWVGSAHLEKKHDKRIDLTGWSPLGENPPDIPENIICAPTVLLNTPLPMEYPNTVNKLIKELTARGIDSILLFKILKAYTFNIDAEDSMFMIIGAPMRRPDPGGDLKQHLSIWEIEPEVVTNLRLLLQDSDEGEEAQKAFINWTLSANTNWCPIYEDRNEVTIRRDKGSTIEWLRGKRVLLLGCGALGSFIGEYVVRAGVAKLDIVDNDIVTPGILIRQLYRDIDIAYYKSPSLKVRLDAIKQSADITAHTYNLQFGALNKFNKDMFDLIIDTSASQSISRVLEEELKKLAITSPIVSLSVSARAEYGMATIRMDHFTGGPTDIARRSKLAVFKNEKARHYASTFWPKQEDISLFQPEPGCSDPTFVGSATDIAYHSSTLLNLALERIESLNNYEASVDFTSKLSIASNANSPNHIGFVFSGVKKLTEPNYNYTVQISLASQRIIEATICQNARIYDPKFETGGLMFGEIAESQKMIWLDEATGPPPDSQADEKHFLCGIDGTKELSEARKKASGGSLRFIGIWHTHPMSAPQPSDTDFMAIYKLLQDQEKPPRHIVMLIIGHSATNPEYSAYLFRRREFLERAKSIIKDGCLLRVNHHGED